MSTQAKPANIVNGVRVDDLFKFIDDVKATPRNATFRFRVRNEWIDCGHNRSMVDGFHGAQQDIRHKTRFVLDADEPEILLGKDEGANPVEYLLHALAACVTSSMVYHAAARGIKIDEIECSVEGKIDTRGFLGLDDTVRNGYQNIEMKFRINAEGTDEQIQELCRLGPTFSPVFDSISKGVPISVTCERKQPA